MHGSSKMARKTVIIANCTRVENPQTCILAIPLVATARDFAG
jgi:hypothetical protein